MNEQEMIALDKFRRIRASHLAATWRALADLLELLPGLLEGDEPGDAARGLLYCDDSEEAAGLAGLIAGLRLPVPVPSQGDLLTPEALAEFTRTEEYRRAWKARHAAEG